MEMVVVGQRGSRERIGKGLGAQQPNNSDFGVAGMMCSLCD